MNRVEVAGEFECSECVIMCVAVEYACVIIMYE